MKKHIAIMASLFLAAFSLKAQQGEILYVDFEPDTVLHVGYHQYPQEIWIDLDNDYLYDIQLYWGLESPGVAVTLTSRDSSVKMCQAEEGDTLLQYTEWWTGTSYPHLHENYAVRIEKDENYYYGWFRVYNVFEPPLVDDFYFDKYAFCTIPNYPLLWGQTEVVGIEENSESFVVATIHPNPTNGMVTIKGDNLHQTQVVNMLGQQVFNMQCKGNELQIDMTVLPAGIYFVNIIDEEGRKCVRKVVKE